MPTVWTILAFSLVVSAAIPGVTGTQSSGSCVDACGMASTDCSCSVGCGEAGDCCSDFVEQCPATAVAGEVCAQPDLGDVCPDVAAIAWCADREHPELEDDSWTGCYKALAVPLLQKIAETRRSVEAFGSCILECEVPEECIKRCIPRVPRPPVRPVTIENP